MVYCKPEFLTVLHFQLKLGFVIILYIYHLSCGAILKQLKRDEIRYSSTKLRIWNEVATILLVAIVCLIVLGYKLNFLYGMIGFVLVGIMLMVGIKLYKRIRKRKEERQNGKSDITKMMEDHSKPEEQSTTISDDDKTT